MSQVELKIRSESICSLSNVAIYQGTIVLLSVLLRDSDFASQANLIVNVR